MLGVIWESWEFGEFERVVFVNEYRVGFTFGWSIRILGVENYVEKWELCRDLLWDGVWKSRKES